MAIKLVVILSVAQRGFAINTLHRQTEFASPARPQRTIGQQPEGKKCKKHLILMARPKRFELLTPRFVVWCSIQLSYGRVGRDGPKAVRPRRPHCYRLHAALARDAGPT